MNHSIILIAISTIMVVSITGCKKNPKVITASQQQEDDEHSTGIFGDASQEIIPGQAATSGGDELHTVVIKEVLPTAKYVYLRVGEGQDEFWIATNKVEVHVGGTYFYRGGLLKTNFESREHNRVFERMYLVSTLVDANHGNTAGSGAADVEKAPTSASGSTSSSGSLRISELVSNPSTYEGQVVQIRGTCTKLNANIMGRNWIHLKDGSMDDFDLVITSDIAVPVGHTVTMRGKVVLNKDFGAGYQYALLLEEGEVVQ